MPASARGAGRRRRALLAAGRQRAVRIGIHSGWSISARQRPARRQDPGRGAPDRRNRAATSWSARPAGCWTNSAARRVVALRDSELLQLPAVGARCHRRAIGTASCPGPGAALRPPAAPQQPAGRPREAAPGCSPSCPTASKSTSRISRPAWSRSSRGPGAPNSSGTRAPSTHTAGLVQPHRGIERLSWCMSRIPADSRLDPPMLPSGGCHPAGGAGGRVRPALAGRRRRSGARPRRARRTRAAARRNASPRAPPAAGCNAPPVRPHHHIVDAADVGAARAPR